MNDHDNKYLEGLIHRLVDHYLDEEVFHGSVAKMPPQQAITLRYLGDKGRMTMSALSGHLKMAPSTLTGIVDRLAEHGYVLREQSRKDRRVVLVKLSRGGRRLFRELTAHRSRFAEQLLKYLNPKQRCQLREHLETIFSGMDREGKASESDEGQ